MKLPVLNSSPPRGIAALLRPTRRWFFALVMGSLLATNCAKAETSDLATAPDWVLLNPDGEKVRLTDFRGKVVVLNFWGTWCLPCRKEIPGFVELQKKYASAGLVVIGIALDDETRLVKAVVRTLHVNYPIVIGNPVVAASYGNVSVLPSTFVINKNGKIAVLHEGSIETAIIEAEIKPLL